MLYPATWKVVSDTDQDRGANPGEEVLTLWTRESSFGIVTITRPQPDTSILDMLLRINPYVLNHTVPIDDAWKMEGADRVVSVGSLKGALGMMHFVDQGNTSQSVFFDFQTPKGVTLQFNGTVTAYGKKVNGAPMKPLPVMVAAQPVYKAMLDSITFTKPTKK
jgi:hypothetical protein